jgi:hypothetical protein
MPRTTVLKASVLGGSFVAALCALSATGSAAINGFFENQALSGADPSTLTHTDTFNGVSGSASVKDTAPTGTGSDRYDFLLSNNFGTSAFQFPVTQSFFISADVTLTAGVTSPRKEAGIRINGTGANAGNDGLYLVNTDAGEIVAFGGNQPFALFGNNSNATNNTNGNGHPYTNGDTIYMAESYDAVAGTLTLYAQDLTAGGALYSSGPNTTFSPVGPFNLGFYSQWTPSSSSDSNNAVFSNISLVNNVPEPATFSVLTLGSLGLLARRRAQRSA